MPSEEKSNEKLPSLDCHAHFEPTLSASELVDTGAVLAMTLSLAESTLVVDRNEPHITWGVGCYPRNLEAQQAFDKEHFYDLVERSAIVGEVGLDTNSRVPLELQRQNFRQILEIVTEIPRLISIHSYRATELVIKELRQKNLNNAIPVLHWWTGSADLTQEAVTLGCYFSIHSAVARHSKFRTRVPPERILIESDHGYRDPPSAIPCRIEWVEHLVGQQLKLNIKQVRHLVWRNLGSIVQKTDTRELFPKIFTNVLKKVSRNIV
ncbi:MAG: TatD family hydrolase [Candidatus Heimdallarchaeota archaeon]|nr:MAG: TatD family hydrolase [Candidatus Heimdallarchaeota archaeon]